MIVDVVKNAGLRFQTGVTSVGTVAVPLTFVGDAPKGVLVLPDPDNAGEVYLGGDKVSPPADEVQEVSISGSPTGGTFTLTFKGETTAPIAFDASAADVKAALEGLDSIDVGDVATAGGALPTTAVTVTFEGKYGSLNVTTMTADGSLLTGGTDPDASVSVTTEGSRGGLEVVTGGVRLPVSDPSSIHVVGSDYTQKVSWATF